MRRVAAVLAALVLLAVPDLAAGRVESAQINLPRL